MWSASAAYQMGVTVFSSSLNFLSTPSRPLFTPNAHSSSHTVEFPILTFSSGPTNSMRGAMWLSGLRNALVVDVGGTTTDIGTLKDGFPREASTQREVRPPGGEWGDSVLW